MGGDGGRDEWMATAGLETQGVDAAVGVGIVEASMVGIESVTATVDIALTSFRRFADVTALLIDP